MSKFTGNIIRLPAVTPTQNSASGVYTLDDQFTAQSSGTWPIVRDQYFNYTTLLLTGAVQGTAYPNPVTQPYSFLSDASTNNFVVSPNGDVSARPFNPYLNNYSNFFDGSADFLSISNNVLLQLTNSTAFTIEAWVYPVSIANNPQIVFAYNPSSPYQGYSLRILTSSGLFEMFDGTAWTSFGAAQINTWQHIAVSYEGSGTTRRFFLNGVQQGSAITVPSTINWTSGGLNISSSAESFNGYISNLRIVKGTAVYTSNFTPPTAPLAAITNTSLLTCQSNRFKDSSNNNLTLTVSGNVAVSQNSPFVSYDTTNGSGYFDGTNDNLMVADANALDLGLGNFTIECWIYLAGGSGTFRQFFSKYTGGVGIEWYVSNANKLEVYFNGGAGQITSTGTINTNTWYHVALVRSGTGAAQTKFYINGSEDGSNQVNLNLDNAGALYIGESGAASNDYLGYICDMRVIKGTAVYTGNFTPPIAPIRTSGAASAASYPSTTNVNTLFAESATSLLTLQTRAPATNNGFIDSSPNNFVVTRNGNATQGSFSPFSPTGWGNYFNGSNAYLNTATSSDFAFGTGNFQIEFFFFPQSTTSQRLVYFSVTDQNQITCDTNYNVVYYDGTNLRTIGTANANAWNHVVVAKSSGTVSCWLNGSRTVNALTDASNTSSNRGVFLGATNAGTERLTGYMSNVSIIKGSTTYSGASITVPVSPLTVVSGTVLLTCQSNRFKDNSPNNFNITVNGSPSVQAFSPFAPAQSYIPSQIGGSGYFDGTGSGTAADYLTVPDSPAFTLGTNAFMVETWVYPTNQATVSTEVIIGQWRPGSYGWIFQYRNNRVLFYYTTDGVNILNAIDASATIFNLAWNHIAFVRSGNTLSAFVNGVRVSTNSSFTANIVNSSQIIDVGRNGDNAEYLYGYLSGLRMTVGSTPYDPTQTTITVPTAPPTAIPNTSLLLNFTNGGIVDATGKNNLETVANSGVQTTQAKWSPGSMYFDGNGDRVTMPGGALLTLGSGDFTVEAWVYKSASNAYMTLGGNWTSAGENTWQILADATGNKICWFAVNSFVLTSSATLNTNTWYYIAFVRSGSSTNNFKLYINGSLDSQATMTTDFNNTVRPLFVGHIPALDAGRDWNGYVDDFRITKGIARTITASPTGPFPLG